MKPRPRRPRLRDSPPDHHIPLLIQPLQGYKKLIRGQVRRLRRRLKQQGRLAPLQPSTERGVQGGLFEGQLPLEGPDTEIVLRQERKGDPDTSVVYTEDDNWTVSPREAAFGWHDGGMVHVVGEPGEMQDAYTGHASPGLGITHATAERQTTSAQEKQGWEEKIFEDPFIQTDQLPSGQLVKGVVEELPSDAEEYRLSWISDEEASFQQPDQPRFVQEDLSNTCRFSTGEVIEGGDESSQETRTQRVGGPVNTNGAEGSGMRSNAQHDVLVEIEDPLTTDLILAEQGQLFHADQARTRRDLCRPDRPDCGNDGHPASREAMMSATHQVKVTVRHRTVTEISTNAVISVDSDLLPGNTEPHTVVNSSLCLSPNANHVLSGKDQRRHKIRRVKVVHFADEVGRPLCSNSSVVQHERLTNQGPFESRRKAPVKIEREAFVQTSDGLRNNQEMGRESSGQKSKGGSVPAGMTIHSVQTREVDDNSTQIRKRGKYKADPSPPEPLLIIKDSSDNLEDRWSQPVTAASPPSKQQPSPSPDIRDDTSEQSQSNSQLVCESAVDNWETTKETLLGADAKPSPVKGMHPTGSSRTNMEITEANTRTFPSISTQTSALTVNRDSAPRADLFALHETGTRSAQSERSCRPFVYRLIRLCIVILCIVVVAHLMALFLAVGFVTECDRYNLFFSPVWGFPWVQVDLSPLAVVLKQNLNLVNFKPPPT